MNYLCAFFVTFAASFCFANPGAKLIVKVAGGPTLVGDVVVASFVDSSRLQIIARNETTAFGCAVSADVASASGINLYTLYKFINIRNKPDFVCTAAPLAPTKISRPPVYTASRFSLSY